MARKMICDIPKAMLNHHGRYYYTGDGVQMDSDLYLQHDVGDTLVFWYAAPGGGKRVEEVIEKNDERLVTKIISDTWQDPEDYDEY